MIKWETVSKKKDYEVLKQGECMNKFKSLNFLG